MQRRPGDKARREGLRGALGVVGVVGLLSAGAVALVLVLTGQDDGERDGSSVSVGTRDYTLEDASGPGGGADPSASASSGEKEKDGEGGRGGRASAGPSVTASAGSSASAKGSEESKEPGDTSDARPAARPAPARSRRRRRRGCGSSATTRSAASMSSAAGPSPGAGSREPGARSPEPADDLGLRREFRLTALDVRVGRDHAGARDVCAARARLDRRRRGTAAGGLDGGAAQRFELNHRHDIVSALANKCADVQDAAPANGTRVQLWSCNGLDQQKWSRA